MAVLLLALSILTFADSDIDAPPTFEAAPEAEATADPAPPVPVNVPLNPETPPFLFEPFSDDTWSSRWVVSSVSNVTGKWDLEVTDKPQATSGEKMLFMKTEKAYYGLSTLFPTPLKPAGKPLIVQYEVRLQGALECGGAYLKLFGRDNFAPAELSNETRYIIMFGPDKCGYDSKVHFIFRHKSPKTLLYEEKHAKDPPAIETDKINHLYTLIVRPDNTFEIQIDTKSVRNGTLLTSFEPSVNPPREVDDPTDTKPADWVDDEQIDDPEASKPADWDEDEPEFVKDPAKLTPPEGWLPNEEKFVPDESAAKPEDWDDGVLGDWEPPTVPNPKCAAAPGCGEYDPPLIKNSLYKGKWKARQIPNPDYFEDAHPANFEEIIGAGFELWMVSSNVGFKNVYIGTDEEAVTAWNKAHFLPKFTAQKAAQEKLKPPKKKKPSAVVGAFKQFFDTVGSAWSNLYQENQIATIVVSGLVVLVPLLLCIACCGRSSKAPPPPEAAPGTTKEEEEKETVPSGDEDGTKRTPSQEAKEE
jgi:calnexin